MAKWLLRGHAHDPHLLRGLAGRLPFAYRGLDVLGGLLGADALADLAQPLDHPWIGVYRAAGRGVVADAAAYDAVLSPGIAERDRQVSGPDPRRGGVGLAEQDEVTALLIHHVAGDPGDPAQAEGLGRGPGRLLDGLLEHPERDCAQLARASRSPLLGAKPVGQQQDAQQREGRHRSGHVSASDI